MSFSTGHIPILTHQVHGLRSVDLHAVSSYGNNMGKFHLSGEQRSFYFFV